MSWFPIKKNQEEPESSFTFDWDNNEPTGKAYLKKMALETVVGFVAKTMSLSTFRHSKDGKRMRGDLDYLLNVRPNNDQSAAEFWAEVTRRMILKGKVLLIPEGDQLLIADSYTRVEYAIYPDTFKDVVVKDFTFDRTYKMGEVIFLQYSNSKLESFTSDMFEDYTKLFNRSVDTALRSNQVRGVVEIDATTTLDDKKKASLQDFINKLFKAFRDKAVAIVPQMKGFKYTEVAKGEGSGKSTNELFELKKGVINEVAAIINVPQKLVHGDISDVDSLMKAYLKLCIAPLNKIISDELNAKLLEKEEYQAGQRIEVFGLQFKDATELAAAVDKLVASGTYTRNEVRVKFGDEPADDPELDKYVMTKNYAPLDETSKGGEKEE